MRRRQVEERESLREEIIEDKVNKNNYVFREHTRKKQKNKEREKTR